MKNKTKEQAADEAFKHQQVTNRKPQKKYNKPIENIAHVYAQIIEGANEGIVIIKDYKIAFANKKAAEISGYTVDEILKTSLEEIIAPKYLQHAMDIYQRRMNRESVPAVYEIALVRKDGQTVPVELSSARIEYEGGHSSVVLLTDITERKKWESVLKASEQKYSKLVEQSKDAILIVQDYVFKFANKAATELVGYSKEELIG
ncbi:MAG: PAS domain S-box protein, partial [Chloroflexota bacterium]|nr:PAS domain S-box protein [Chloroflexota bacterium]